MVFCASGGKNACPDEVTLPDGTFAFSPMRGTSSAGIPANLDPGVATNLGAVKYDGLKSESSVLTLTAGSMNKGGTVVGTGTVWDTVG